MSTSDDTPRQSDSAPDVPLAPTSYEPGGSWGTDTLDSLRRSRRIAWTVAGAAGGLALLQAVTILVMLPLKREVPYTITVDRNTGYVQTARGVRLGPISETEAVAKAALVQYVLSREGFDAQDYRENFRRTLLWSVGGAEQAYQRDWDRNNPAGIRSRVRETSRIEVTVKNVTLTSPTTAIVAFDTVQTEGPTSGGNRNAYTAAVTFAFSGAPLNETDRYLNPLGFQVSDYRRDTQTFAPVSMPAPPLPPPPPPPPVQPAIDPVTGLPVQTAPGSGTGVAPGLAPGGAAAPSPGTAGPSGEKPADETPAGAYVPVDPGIAP